MVVSVGRFWAGIELRWWRSSFAAVMAVARWRRDGVSEETGKLSVVWCGVAACRNGAFIYF